MAMWGRHAARAITQRYHNKKKQIQNLFLTPYAFPVVKKTLQFIESVLEASRIDSPSEESRS